MLYEVKEKGCCDFSAVFDLSVEICCGGRIINTTSHGCCVSSEAETARPYKLEQDICCDTQVLSRVTHDSCDVVASENDPAENGPAYRQTTTLYDIWCEECRWNDIGLMSVAALPASSTGHRIWLIFGCVLFSPGVIGDIFA